MFPQINLVMQILLSKTCLLVKSEIISPLWQKGKLNTKTLLQRIIYPRKKKKKEKKKTRVVRE